MFLKLFKYDFLSVMKKMLFYYIILIGIALFSFLMNLLFTKLNQSYYMVYAYLIDSLYKFTIFGGFFISIVLCIVKYYQSMHSDQAYLTHTLPVETKVILLSKLVCNIVIQIITVLAILFSLLVRYLDNAGQIFQIISSTISGLFQIMDAGMFILVILILILALALSVSYICMCITLGAMSNKNKKLFAFLYYMGINFGIEIVFVILGLSLTPLLVNVNLSFTAILWIFLFLMSGFEVLIFFITSWSLKKHLNLL